MTDSGSEYNRRIEQYEAQSKELAIRLNRISNLRLLTAVVGFGTAGFLLFRKDEPLSAAIFILTLILFLCLVVRHGRWKREKIRVDILQKINEDSVKRLEGGWTAFEDTGAEFQDPEHDFSDDLDLFGRNSLFQWMNTAKTCHGRNALKGLLIHPPKQREEIHRRQEAAKELSGLLDWRQQLQAEALLSSGKFQDPEPFIQWAQQRNARYGKPALRCLVRILPPVTILLFVGAFLFPALPLFVPFLFLIAQIGLLGFGFVDVNRILSGISPFLNNIKAYGAMLEKVEKQEFHGEVLKGLQQKLRNAKGETAGNQIRELEKVLNMAAIRENQLYLIINILLLWDVQCMTALEKWKTESGSVVRDWIAVLGEMEALSSLAVLYCDHPDWAVPVIYEDQPRLFATAVGHPLLPGDRVCNDINMMKSGQVFLITGSNMSGKSTLLRTVGVNLVLAYAGAPVCAKEFHGAVFDLYTSMRVRDDLEGSISSFYAELLRIKRMIEATKRGEPVFFLLDEIFKGTNSRDRHTGARILIRLLSSEGAIGFVSTHDVELGNLAEETGRIRNYHFREYYREGQLLFDYKLRKGVSDTRNAIYLMKMAGIDVPEGEA